MGSQTRTLTSKERVLTALRHQEPDHVPFDLGGTTASGISKKAYAGLLGALGRNGREIRTLDLCQQLAEPDEDVLTLLRVDARGVIPYNLRGPDVRFQEDAEGLRFTDAWGIEWRMPKEGGWYFDTVGYPLQGGIEPAQLDAYPWPDLEALAPIDQLLARQKELAALGDYATVLRQPAPSFFEYSFLLRGWEEFYIDLALNPERACDLMDRELDLLMEYWRKALPLLWQEGTILYLGDDLGGQKSLLISPEMYRTLIKPRHQRYFSFLRELAPGPIHIMLHSCGDVSRLIADLIEVGVDILNPVQIDAGGMGAARIKRDFGDSISFWGGGVDTQQVLPFGTPQQVRDQVKKRIDDLAPGGGLIFAAVHNIQAGVPAENIIAMWEAWEEYGWY